MNSQTDMFPTFRSTRNITPLKPGFAKRTTVYGVIVSLVVIGVAVACGSFIVGGIGVLSMGIHIVSNVKK